MRDDPPFSLGRPKTLTPGNRIMPTAPQPACSGDGMPTDRDLLDHVGKTGGGAITLTTDPATGSPRIPRAADNLRGPDGLRYAKDLR